MSRRSRWLVRPWPVSRGWVIAMLLITVGDGFSSDDHPMEGIGPPIGGTGVFVLVWTILSALADMLDHRKARLGAEDITDEFVDGECRWCGIQIVRDTNMGPIPKYCSASHRQRAYKQRRMDRLTSGRRRGA